MILHKLSILSLAFWLFFQTAATPTPTPSAENKTSELSPELKKEATALLNSVARETAQFSVPENRIRTQVIVADLMWQNDDERAARALFQSALIELQNMVNQTVAASSETDELKTSEQTELYTKQYSLSLLRQVFVLTLAPHDPQAALNALQTLKTPTNGEEDPYNTEGLELQLASAIAQKDPAKAYQLAKSQLNDGISYQLIETLKDLHKKDSEMAAKLSKDILAKLRTSKIRTPSADTATTTDTTNTSGTTGGRTGSSEIDFWQVTSFVSTASTLNRLAQRDKEKKLVAVLSDAEMKELVELIGRSFLAEKNPAPYSISSILNEITLYSPAMVQRIRAKIGAEAARQLDAMAESNSYYSDRSERTLDELIDDADKAPADMRDARYSEAVWKAIEMQDPEKARELANKIKDKKSYAYIFEQIEAAIPLAKARRGDMQEVRNMLATLSSNDEKITTLSELAMAIAGKGDKETAKKLLDEAVGLMPGRLKKQEQLASALSVTNAYAIAAPDQAFTMLDNNIAQMNDYINAGIMLDDFYNSGSLENDELLFSAASRQGLINVSNSVNLLKNLAEVDFERTLALADKFQRPEIRFLVRLKIAQALLDPKAAEHEKEELEKAQGEYEGH